MPKKIRVNIRASQRVHYNQTVEMTPSEWKEFKDTPPEETESEQGILSGGWLDLRDVDYADGFEDIEAVVVDEKGKVKKPIDNYYAG